MPLAIGPKTVFSPVIINIERKGTKEVEGLEERLADRSVCGAQEEEIANLKRRVDGYQRNLMLQAVAERAGEEYHK